MAACANWLICLSSSCRGTEGWFLVLGIVSPTATTSIAALATVAKIGSLARYRRPKFKFDQYFEPLTLCYSFSLVRFVRKIGSENLEDAGPGAAGAFRVVFFGLSWD